jgi:hypothetical protein
MTLRSGVAFRVVVVMLYKYTVSTDASEPDPASVRMSALAAGSRA